MKVCGKCGKSKEHSEFFARSASKDGLQSRCKQCSSRTATEWSKKNYTPESGREKYLRKYGLTPEQFSQMVEDQRGRCFTCEKVTDDLKIDHCHKTGKVRRLLCNGCNTALGLVYENPEILKNLIVYLENWQSLVDCSGLENRSV